ncbi:unnamed protein product [Heligmosomoides polygyrus]|uniref:Uncharacterized protein n=1 Tax=Heligmosomoides polygyrus TaxID=6339 RepID=A0A3P7Z856_HELPZ|nr:unnamed protein product [Heligmosomoides polygyrus]
MDQLVRLDPWENRVKSSFSEIWHESHVSSHSEILLQRAWKYHRDCCRRKRKEVKEFVARS